MRPALFLLCTALLAAAASAAPAFTPPKNDEELIDAMRKTLREPYANKHEREILLLLEYLTPKNADSVRTLFGEFNQDGIHRDFAWNAYWRRRGEIDGEATLEMLLAGDSTPGHAHHADVMEGWASVDPAAAERWMRAHTGAKYFWVYYQRVIAAWARTDADRATEILFDLAKDEKYVDDALPILCETLRLTGTTQRIATWFDTLNDSAKQVAMHHAFWRIKDGPIEAAAQWFGAQAGKPWRDDQHFQVFLNRYVDASPKAAMEWAMSLPLPSGVAFPRGAQAGARRWAQKDRTSANAWLTAHQGNAWWPRAASGYVKALREKGGSADEYLSTLDSTQRTAVEKELKPEKQDKQE